jgi:galactose mutarotase-like enzyme
MLQLTTEWRHGIETVILSNDLVSAVILAGKGADLLEFIWKPLHINCLYRSDEPMEVYDHLKLSETRLLNHSDHLLGGWVDALPHRGSYKDVELSQDNGGIAATLPWHYEVVKNDKKVISIRLWVDLPVFPMHLEKTFTLYDNSSSLYIDETVTNQGDAPMSFTWTQHALFNFLSDATTLEVDSDIVFKAWEHMADPGGPLEAYETNMREAELSQGMYDLRHPIKSDRSEFVVFNHLGKGEAALMDKDLQLAVRLNWDIVQFPYLRSLYQGSIIGLEPGNDMFSGFEHSLKYGTYKILQANEQTETSFILSFIDLHTVKGR